MVAVTVSASVITVGAIPFVGLINALVALEGGPVSPRQLLARAEAWRPLRAYAAQHLWTSLSRVD